MKLSLIIPVYNESKRINKGLTQALNYLKSQPYSWELIVVDDGSTDHSTSEVAKNISDGSRLDSSEVKLIRTARNFGKGHAIRLGVEASRADYIVFSDIDFSVPPDFITLFLVELKSTDIVIGSRRLSQSQVVKRQNFFRESLGHGFTKLSNLVLGLNHSDLTCGLKGFRSKVAHDLFSRQTLNRWAFDAEILYLANKLGYQVTELPIVWNNHSLTKVKLLQDIPSSFLNLLSIRWNHL